MKTLVKRLLTLAVILGLIGGGYVVFARNAASKKPTITYETGQAATGNIRSFVTATGIIQPWKVVDVKANVAGRIDKLYVDLGATVKAGQAIADIDPTDTRTALEQANADLQSARAREQQAQASVEQQKMQAASRVASAE
ncbi:MAG TPA: biotin/lipoyl-binding protein, partial [Armatimonadota bacterium]|nr:biotin/lipoyl-binding protein [Armatimonadota bacterium]